MCIDSNYYTYKYIQYKERKISKCIDLMDLLIFFDILLHGFLLLKEGKPTVTINHFYTKLKRIVTITI